MNELLKLAQTRDEYLLIAALLAPLRVAARSLTMGAESFEATCRPHVIEKLAEFRALPRSVDSYEEVTSVEEYRNTLGSVPLSLPPQCPTGQTQSPSSPMPPRS